MTTYDTLIIGGGIVGLSTAYVLTQQGKTVLLLEQVSPAHDKGSSHGDGRMTRYAYGAGEAVYLEMVKRSFSAWAHLSEISNTPLLQTTGLLNFGAPESPYLDELEIAFNDSNIAYEHLTVAECLSRFPQFYVPPNTEIIYEPSGGIIFADKAIQVLWALCKDAGVVFQMGQRVETIVPNDNAVTLHTVAGEQYHGREVVIAMGAWATNLLNQLDITLDLTVTQEQIAYFRPKDKAVNHAVGVMPNCLDYHTAQPMYSLAEVDGHGVKVGWHHTGKLIDADVPLPIDTHNLATVQDFVRQRYPHLDPNPSLVKPCLYTNSPDYHFVIDRHPKHTNIVFAVGFSGHGFKFGTVLGEMIASLLNQSVPPVPMTQFSLSRFDTMNTLKRRITA